MATHEPPLEVPILNRDGALDEAWKNWFIVMRGDKANRVESGTVDTILVFGENGHPKATSVTIDTITGEITSILEGLDNEKIVASTSSGTLQEINLSSWVSGGGGVTITDDGDGSITISLSGVSGSKLVSGDGAGGLAMSDISSWINSGTGITVTDDGSGGATVAVKSQSNIPSISTPISITTPLSSPVSATALRDNLVSTTLPDLSSAISDNTTKINLIISALIAAEIIASP